MRSSSKDKMRRLSGKFILVSLFILLFNNSGFSQANNDTLLNPAGLQSCIQYAFHHQPALQQAQIDKAINERDIKSQLSSWYPQINLDYNLNHYLKQPVILFPDSSGKRAISTGSVNNSTVSVEADQTLYSSDLLLASKAAKYSRQQTEENITNSKIDLVVNVSKAFYDVLTTEQQINILNEDIVRLKKNLNDTYSQFQAGTVDKVDYQRATISLNNSLSEKRSALAALKYKYTYLKQQMGYPTDQPLMIAYDTSKMGNQVYADTLSKPDYHSRIEYQQLQTQAQLLNLNVSYYRYGFLPTLSAFVNYNLAYMNDNFGDIYNTSFPNSQVGLTLSLPIFQGTRRLQNLQKARLQYQRLQIGITDIKQQINTQYSGALANYQSNLDNYLTLKQNKAIAQEVYNTIKLQYDAGVKTYLEVITAEADLRTAELNYLNALYQALSAKLDLERALGVIDINQ